MQTTQTGRALPVERRIHGLISMGAADLTGLIQTLERVSISALPEMYDPKHRSFVFKRHRDSGSVVAAGRSPRYTAIALIGLAEVEAADRACVLHNCDVDFVVDQICNEAATSDCIGDVALTLWAAARLGHPRAGEVYKRLVALDPIQGPVPTVELAWALTALTVAREIAEVENLSGALTNRLIGAFDADAHVFRHMVGLRARRGFRAHISCFADMVYPIQALSRYHVFSGRAEALSVADQAAETICRLQGPEGQWWWHYDNRVGDVAEGYPVYSVHQDSMAPMALFDLKEAGGTDHSAAIALGLEWLAYAPEIEGSLIDLESRLVWRKVARVGPAKLVRRLRAVARRVSRSSKLGCLDMAFAPGRIDYECRPYHLGWILHTWSRSLTFLRQERALEVHQ